MNTGMRYTFGRSKGTITISLLRVGGTFAELNFYYSANNVNSIEFYVNNQLNKIVTDFNQSVYLVNLNEQTNFNVYAIINYESSFQKESNTINFNTQSVIIAPLYNNAVAYYKQNETQGNAIDQINAYNGNLIGNIQRNGEYYIYDQVNEYVEIPSNPDFSFADLNTNKIDFVIKTEIVFDGFNLDRRAWFVSKRNIGTGNDREWQLYYLDGKISFAYFDSNNELVAIDYILNVIFGKKYQVGATLKNNILSLFIDGLVVNKIDITNKQFKAPINIPVRLGDELFADRLNFIGKQKETLFIKNAGWDEGQISEMNRNGQGSPL